MEDYSEPANLRFLRRLVTVLTVVMICGVLVVIALLVTRLNREATILPDAIALPEGARALAFTQGGDWYAVVTTDNRIFVFDRLTGALRQTLVVEAQN